MNLGVGGPGRPGGDGRRVGVIGVGELGGVVTKALTAAGRSVVGYDPTPHGTQRLASAGASSTESPAAVARACDVVIVAVATLEQVRDVLLGDDGVFTNLDRGVVVVHSTIDPASSADLAAQAPEEITFVDAPVSFRRTEPPTFLAFVGTGSGLDADTRGVLDAYCHEIVECGFPGAGQAAKLVNNVMSLLNTAAATEALHLAQTFGIESSAMRTLAMNGSGASHALATWEPRATLFEPGVGDDRRRSLAAKDLLAALRMAERADLALPLTRSALALIQH